MGGCDFSPRGYTYADIEGDLLLEHFSLQEEDIKFKVGIKCLAFLQYLTSSGLGLKGVVEWFKLSGKML